MARLLAIVALASIAGCVTVHKTVLMDRSSTPVPASEVYVFLPEDEIPEDCERVALFDAEGEQDLTSEADMLDKMREEAGKLGANAIQIREVRDAGTGERIVGAVFDTPVERRGNAIALWCPSRAGG
ncbi:MAG: hypothetical protein KJO11_12555 [Gemmatimonadetes bacterium]|nr:hypothetical protein [Gemmatimonadota bacterium]MBT8403704.1 hypothetical protein [Gemmatimonadota bacterium]NNF37870.1 hypothetical protein [Gemmatimonadota bacterium]NNK61843.1 hypothetical protein [Gemmatimonadota bacterium]